MELIEALNKMRTWIPFQRKEDEPMIDALASKFTAYIDLLKSVNEDDFGRLFAENEQCYNKTGKKAFVNLINSIQETIKNAISVYNEGNPSKAYLFIESLLLKNKFLPKEDNRTPRYANNKLIENLDHYFRFELKMKGDDEDYFRMRISEKALSKEEMFHISFKEREKVSTQRFSISGYPSLYLGTSLEVCWDEIKPKEEIKDKNIYACRFQKEARDILALLNLKIPDEFTQHDLDSYSSLCFLLTFPFYLSCLIQTKNPDKPFKPEYIIPQILLQYVNVALENGSVRFEGIIYPSTKLIPFEGNRYNLVFPCHLTSKKNKKYSSELIETFLYTEPIVVESEKLEEAEKKLRILELSTLKYEDKNS